VYTNYVLKAGDVISAGITAVEPPCDLVPEAGDIDILFENSGLIAVNKPCGMLVHPSRAKYTGTLANLVAGYLLKSSGDGSCHAVNRLDRDTSGVVLFAKNAHYKDLASRAIKDGVKTYLAVVCGAFGEPSGTSALPIKRAHEGDMLRVVSPDGQSAVTEYETLAVREYAFGTVSFLRLKLLTGRTHQIRVHCTAMGHPLLGDVLYNDAASRAISEELGFSAQALHAAHLSLCDPVSGDRLDIKAPMNREDMANISSDFVFLDLT
ncbi:MAG: RluA family pseudouridine synthase, partial [Clostridia bacterium]|nr:RluA family pseudouridine synthase [Clostridia bacterium]